MDFNHFISNNLDIILIILGIFFSLIAIKLVTKILFRLLILIVIFMGSFIGYQTFSGTNIIDTVENLYCNKKEQDLKKCECFVKPILKDLRSRFSEEEIEELKAKKLRANTEFIKSYKLKEQEIKICFKKSGEQKGILEEIMLDIKERGLKILK